MNKAYEYARLVVDGELIAPSQVRKQCENFLHEYDKLQLDESYEYMWSDKIEKKIYKIIKLLNFARGNKSAQPMYPNLTKFQWFLILNTFCWVYKQFPTRRKHREIIFTVARKNAKSVVACICHIICFFLDEENQTAYIGSNTKQQAEIIFDELTAIISSSPIKKLFDLKTTRITFLPKNCKIIPLSGDAKRADGTMVYHCSIDELGADNEIYKMVSSLETGAFGPDSPLIIKISTSYPVENDYNYWQEQVKKLIDNTMSGNSNPRLWGLAYLIDNPLDEIVLDGKKAQRWEDKSTWLEANPLIAEIPELNKKLHEDYQTKKDIPSDLHLFKTKNLNIWQSENFDETTYFMNGEKMKQYEMPELSDWKWWQGKQVIIGIDLSHSGTDNTSVTFGHYDYKNRKTYLKNIVYYPSNLAAKKSGGERIPYEKWSRAYDWVVPMGDNSIDYEGVGREIERIIKENNLKVGTILYDDKYSLDLMKYLNKNVKMQVPSVRAWQDARGLGPAVTSLQKEFLDGNVFYAPSNLFVSACTNGKIVLTNGKPRIEKTSKMKHKVDSLLSTLNTQTGIMIFIRHNKFNPAPKVMAFR